MIFDFNTNVKFFVDRDFVPKFQKNAEELATYDGLIRIADLGAQGDEITVELKVVGNNSTLGNPSERVWYQYAILQNKLRSNESTRNFRMIQTNTDETIFGEHIDYTDGVPCEILSISELKQRSITTAEFTFVLRCFLPDLLTFPDSIPPAIESRFLHNSQKEPFSDDIKIVPIEGGAMSYYIDNDTPNLVNTIEREVFLTNEEAGQLTRWFFFHRNGVDDVRTYTEVQPIRRIGLKYWLYRVKYVEL